MGEKWRKALDLALNLEIEPDVPSEPGDYAEFAGKALGASVRLRISGSALVQIAGEDGSIIKLAGKHRARIEKMFRARFRASPGPDILLTSYNLPPS